MSTYQSSNAWRNDTRAVRAGQSRSHEGEHNDPIHATSSFVFASAQEAASRFVDDAPGNVYARFTNPTVRLFEERLAAMEGVRYGVATASGMAAIASLGFSLLKAGDHIVASRDVFGSTVNLFSKIFSRFGVTTTFVPLGDLDAWREAVQPNTQLLFLETPSNPLIEVADIAGVAAIAREAGCKLVVDNCLCTPALQRPAELGADIIVHSATKYLDGQGRCVGGAVVTDDEAVHDAMFGFLRTAGPSMSPFNAWVFANGLETLKLRMKAHCASATQVAHWLEAHPAVERVVFPGLSSHPQHALAQSQQDGPGAIIAFAVRGGRQEAWDVVNAVQTISITANFGDAKSTITHPATTTHGRLSDAERANAGITENMLRLSVGLEDVDDLFEDLQRGLGMIKRGVTQSIVA
jgi:O-succinylhomoserine sulfhydrylase